jgi:DNA-binding PadR family transcriptional regulator
LYLLALLGEGEQHGYQIIRTLQERIGGDYRPSAGTVYPRLRQLEREGLVHAREEGGRIFYQLTSEGRAAVHDQEPDVQDLLAEIGRNAHAFSSALAADIRSSARELRQEMRSQSKALRSRDQTAPFSAQLQRELARFSDEWRRLAGPETTEAQARAALAAAIAAAVAELKRALQGAPPPS